MRRPAPLVPPATIALLAPASAPRDADLLSAGIQTLESLGFHVITPAGGSQRGYLAASDDERLAEINALLRRDDVDALVCVRGGFGTMRLLDRLDYEAARRHPKLLVGYSDITALQLALYKNAGWRSLSGPMAAVEWCDPDPSSTELFLAMAAGATPSPLLGPGAEPLVPARPGDREGVLLGGNLSMVIRLIGTPYLPDLRGAILFIEDVGEAPYRIDAFFAQLRLSGVLDQIGGLIIGELSESEPPTGQTSLSLAEVIADYTGSAPYPVATGLRYGHIRVKNTMPIGVRARLTVTADAARLDILEPVVG